MKKRILLGAILLAIVVFASSCDFEWVNNIVSKPDNDRKVSSVNLQNSDKSEETTPIQLSDVPAFNNEASIEINSNTPFFTEDEYTTSSYEYYSDLDNLGRCGVCYACIGPDIMPTEERGPIGMVKPSGWQTIKFDFVDGKYLYNRCHLIGYQLTGENANTKNLITGTRYLNVVGMLPYENEVADYVYKTKNHVLYRVTPMFQEDNLVANAKQEKQKQDELFRLNTKKID